MMFPFRKDPSRLKPGQLNSALLLQPSHDPGVANSSQNQSFLLDGIDGPVFQDSPSQSKKEDLKQGRILDPRANEPIDKMRSKNGGLDQEIQGKQKESKDLRDQNQRDWNDLSFEDSSSGLNKLENVPMTRSIITGSSAYQEQEIPSPEVKGADLDSKDRSKLDDHQNNKEPGDDESQEIKIDQKKQISESEARYLEFVESAKNIMQNIKKTTSINHLSNPFLKKDEGELFQQNRSGMRNSKNPHQGKMQRPRSRSDLKGSKERLPEHLNVEQKNQENEQKRYSPRRDWIKRSTLDEKKSKESTNQIGDIDSQSQKTISVHIDDATETSSIFQFFKDKENQHVQIPEERIEAEDQKKGQSDSSWLKSSIVCQLDAPSEKKEPKKDQKSMSHLDNQVQKTISVHISDAIEMSSIFKYFKDKENQSINIHIPEVKQQEESENKKEKLPKNFEEIKIQDLIKKLPKSQSLEDEEESEKPKKEDQKKQAKNVYANMNQSIDYKVVKTNGRSQNTRFGKQSKDAVKGRLIEKAKKEFYISQNLSEDKLISKCRNQNLFTEFKDIVLKVVLENQKEQIQSMAAQMITCMQEIDDEVSMARFERLLMKKNLSKAKAHVAALKAMNYQYEKFIEETCELHEEKVLRVNETLEGRFSGIGAQIEDGRIIFTEQMAEEYMELKQKEEARKREITENLKKRLAELKSFEDPTDYCQYMLTYPSKELSLKLMTDISHSESSMSLNCEQFLDTMLINYVSLCLDRYPHSICERLSLYEKRIDEVVDFLRANGTQIREEYLKIRRKLLANLQKLVEERREK